MTSRARGSGKTHRTEVGVGSWLPVPKLLKLRGDAPGNPTTIRTAVVIHTEGPTPRSVQLGAHLHRLFLMVLLPGASGPIPLTQDTGVVQESLQ